MDVNKTTSISLSGVQSKVRGEKNESEREQSYKQEEKYLYIEAANKTKWVRSNYRRSGRDKYVQPKIASTTKYNKVHSTPLKS